MKLNAVDFLASMLSKTQRAALNRYWEQLAGVAIILRRDKLAMVSLVILVGFTLMAVFAPYLAPYDPDTYHWESDDKENALTLQPPSIDHPMGTTTQAKDVLSIWIFGSRVSILVGFASGFAVMIIGTTVGLVAGYYKGTLDLFLMRFVDILYGIPATPFILILSLFVGTSIWNVMFAMTLVLWRTMARVIRSQTLSLAERPFVKSAKAAGASDFRIMYYHIVPNLLPLIAIETTIVVSWAITLEAGVSFLGLGATELISWGSMLQLTFSSGAIRTAWWWVIPPGVAITLLVMAFFYLSRVVENITDPEVNTQQ